MTPAHKESFENGDVMLSVYQFTNPLKNTYWIKAGVGALEFTEDNFWNLVELIKEYDMETRPYLYKKKWFGRKK